MKISFVIPAHNEEKLIGACLSALERELAHTQCDAEIVVVNNASTDRTGEIARSFSNVRVVDEPKKGLVQARNTGYRNTTGELVANIDADTEVSSGWVATVLKEFEHSPKLVALSGPFIYRDLPPIDAYLVKSFYFVGWIGHLFNQYVFGAVTMIQGGNFVIRRDAWERAGGFNTSLTFYGEDTDVAKRISKQGTVKWTWHLPMYTSGRRIATEGIVRTGWKYAINFFSMSLLNRPVTKKHTDIRP